MGMYRTSLQAAIRYWRECTPGKINLITKGKFQAPRFDKSFWKTYARENRDLVTQIPRLRNAFDSIYRKYNLKNLSTELPEVNIGD